MSVPEDKVPPLLAHIHQSQRAISEGMGNMMGGIHSVLDIEPMDCFHQDLMEQLRREEDQRVESGFLLSAKVPNFIDNPTVLIYSTFEWTWVGELEHTLPSEVSVF